ncbi:MAG: histidine phosphatase family protein [Desulfurococcales archaeon]|nr:histidine phosphatase family protein [Desulfurococcales archaeon]
MVLVAFMRHGEAEQGGPDSERRLTVEGRRQVEAAASAFPFKPRIIYSSPLARAVETAEILARLYNVEVKVVEDLSPGAFSTSVALKLARERAVLVGHNPSMSRVVSALTGCPVSLGTAWVAVVDVYGERGSLMALVPPPGSLDSWR